MNYLILCSFLFLACTNGTPTHRPPLTIDDFDKEEKALKGVITKFIQENDPAMVHDVSLALQSTFAIQCIPVGTECNQYHTIVTNIIQATQDRKFTIEEKMEILKMSYELEKTLQESRKKLIEDWKNYQ